MNSKLAILAVCGGCSFVGGIVADVLMRSPASVKAHAPPLPPIPTQIAADLEKPTTQLMADRFQSIIRKVSPAVVAVDAVKPPMSDPTAKGKPVEESGSGVMVKFPGLAGVVAITNNHVVGAAEPAKVFVTLSDGRIVQPSKIWADAESDISLLHLDDDTLPAIELADSDRAHRGQWVLAFGSPFGLNQTVTHGIISATERGQINLGSTIRIKEFLQTDAAINPGSSGGPLVDLDGRVIGINTAIASKSGDNSGVSFSIPANLVKRIASQLIEKGTVTRGYLGVQLASVLEPAEALRLGLSRVSGALVEIVHPNTPASAGGLKTGDVILKLEDIGLRDENHLINLVSALPPGQKVQLVIWRDRKTQSLTMTVGEYGSQKPRPR
ncbi:MAG: trypsin-like peptidase domain-containing protein [Planctomycetes bacterium]|nr:trypsin-like peptidase domain-containing protein [Planctomycetota bacterium]